MNIYIKKMATIQHKNLNEYKKNCHDIHPLLNVLNSMKKERAERARKKHTIRKRFDEIEIKISSK